MPEHTAHSAPKEVPPFVAWATLMAARDAEMVWSKAAEYGGLSLYYDTLHQLVDYSGYPESRMGIERGIASLVALKLGRIVASLRNGKLPQEDSWRDIMCYAMMARRVRLTGTWPA